MFHDASTVQTDLQIEQQLVEEMMAKKKSPYSVHPSVAYGQAIIGNLADKTGRSIDQWTRLIRKSGPSDARECRDWLKREHGLGGTTARLIADRVRANGSEDTDEGAYLKAVSGYVEAMYDGPKAALRPIHDALVDLGRSLGNDVKVCPCKTIVPLYREHVFAEIKPSTRTRIDLGLALKKSKTKPAKRLISTGGIEKGNRITHRIPISSLDEIDSEVRRWIELAYDLDED